MPDLPSKEAFEAALHTAFELGPVPAELAAVRTTPAAGGWEGFALEFRGPAVPALPQGTHPVRHPVIGAFELFLVPVGADTDGVRYEAIFNSRMGGA